jgi:hypothetical protein
MNPHPYDEKTVARFWAKVNKSGPVHPYDSTLGNCWVWTAAKYAAGYGSLGIGGNRSELSHRISFIIHNGAIPNGKLVCHSCDRRECVNPHHLWLGTHKDNTGDAVNKGRLPFPSGGREFRFRLGYDRRRKRGCESHFAKLSESDVSQIRQQYTGKRGHAGKLGAHYGVHADTILLIVKRKIWKHVP